MKNYEGINYINFFITRSVIVIVSNSIIQLFLYA